MTASHEHFAFSLLKTFLANLARTNITHPGAPHIVIATPRAQHHEMGAYLANTAAANCGWRVTFLGPDLPAAEIAIAARQCGARAVALSLVYPITDASLTGELTQLKNALPPECALVIGGRAAGAHATLINQIGATLIEDLTVFCTWLSR
ncbi:MAG: hypothetical protein FJ405_03100 [Verrucomicrobia bacterium]|nr:hypothetical protein [Verrucomicrobiota bacterium]